MTIRQYNAKGPFVNTILQVVVLDDAVALISFSVCAAVAQIIGNNESVAIQSIVLPILYNIAAIGLGGAAAFLLRMLMRHVLSSYNHLLMTVILLLSLSGICAAVDISPLLSCMVFGTVHANISEGNTVFKRVDRFSPPILTLFFVVSGMRLNVQALATAGIVGVAYFAVRILGKYLGASLGALLARSTPEVKKYLGLALIPQAGVSIGLAALGERILPHDMGALLSTIILSSSVLYEMVGPAAAKLSMHLAGVIPAEMKSAAPPNERYEDPQVRMTALLALLRPHALALLRLAPILLFPFLIWRVAKYRRSFNAMTTSRHYHDQPACRRSAKKRLEQKPPDWMIESDADDLYAPRTDSPIRWDDSGDENENGDGDDEIMLGIDNLFPFRRHDRR